MEDIGKEDLHKILAKGDATLVSKFYDKNQNSIVLSRIKITEVLDIAYDITGDDIIFESCEFEKAISFNGEMTIQNSITFQNCIFNEDVSFISGTFSKIITFANCQVLNSSLNFKGGDFQKIRIDRGSLFKLEFFKGNFKEISIGAFYHEMIIEEVFISCSEIVGKIDFYRIVNFKYDLRGVLNAESFLTISECLIQNFIISEFTNNGKFRLSRLFSDPRKLKKHFADEYKKQLLLVTEKFTKFHSTFFIESSVLNKAELFTIDLSEYFLCSIRESSLIDIVISNINWPREILCLQIPNAENSDNYDIEVPKDISNSRMIRETYRQLKYACSRQGDFINNRKYPR